jgi:membrane associated rhomboid family serine protease
MFHHKDATHWLSNTYSLLVLGHSLDVGPINLLALFFGGGLAGIVAHIIHHTLSFAKSSPVKDLVPKDLLEAPALNWVVKTATGGARASITERIHILCGASAGVYSLMGAECVFVLNGLRQAMLRLKRARNQAGAYEKREREERNLWAMVTVLVSHGVAISTQVISLANGDVSLGYAAHLGGFLFGAGFSALFLS